MIAGLKIMTVLHKVGGEGSKLTVTDRKIYILFYDAFPVRW